MFDHVIVGAGSAGCVLAERLSRLEDRTVLLLESGPVDQRAEIRVPAAFPRLMGTECAWDRTTVAQPGLDRRELYWPSGRTLGGSSSINAQIWTRGHPADFAEWSARGGPEWDADRIRSCFAQLEHRPSDTDPAADIPRPGLWVGPLRDPDVRAREFLAACMDTGIAEVDSSQLSEREGCGMLSVTQHGGRRFSVADGYLKPAAGRDNLTVYTDVQVRRVLFDGTRAVGVEYQNASGQVQQVSCAREILLSAGAVGSPCLLLRSGIGDPQQLAESGIALVACAPEVGRNLADHLHVPLTAATGHDGDHNPTADMRRYLTGRRGPLSSNLAEAVAFIRTTPAEPAPDIELLWMPVQFENHGRTVMPRGFTVCVVLLRPHSRGRVLLGEPTGSPVIDPRYLSDRRDLDTLTRGVRHAYRVMAAQAAEPIGEKYRGIDSDEVAHRVIRQRAETLYHPVGTCRLGTDPGSVVDPWLRVRGVSGLRVVDASVMPTIPGAHTNAATVALAENAAQLIDALPR